MKFMSFMFALFCAGAALAKTDAGLFNAAIREGIKQEIKKDGVLIKQNGRYPASVGPTKSEMLESEEKSIDKVEKRMDQLGHPNW
jgi:hypothetical protein